MARSGQPCAREAFWDVIIPRRRHNHNNNALIKPADLCAFHIVIARRTPADGPRKSRAETERERKRERERERERAESQDLGRSLAYSRDIPRYNANELINRQSISRTIYVRPAKVRGKFQTDVSEKKKKKKERKERKKKESLSREERTFHGAR